MILEPSSWRSFSDSTGVVAPAAMTTGSSGGIVLEGEVCESTAPAASSCSGTASDWKRLYEGSGEGGRRRR